MKLQSADMSRRISKSCGIIFPELISNQSEDMGTHSSNLTRLLNEDCAGRSISMFFQL